MGPETLDDAAALAVSDDVAICFTADFITPVVDDPGQWGRIAAANSISDIYAMGATPLAALNLVCWPDCLPLEMLTEVLQGGAKTAAEARCLVVGGHTIHDREPKYGMAVIGTVHPNRILRNRGAKPGDVLYLGKPLGAGVLSTAIKADLASPEEIAAAVASMTALNRAASLAAIAAHAHALTDVTGFGLVGHLAEMLGPPGGIGAAVSMSALPLLPGTIEHARGGLIPAGAYRNRDAFRDRVRFAADVTEDRRILVFDPQTSGGLLAAIAPENASRFESEAAQRGAAVWRVGVVTMSGQIEVLP